MHEHPASVSVYLTDVHQRFTGEDGKAREVKHKVGDVAYASAAKRAEENLSDKPLELVLIELKPGAPRPVSPPITLDPVKLDPKHHIVVLENDRVRALRTILEPHLKSPMHEQPALRGRVRHRASRHAEAGGRPIGPIIRGNRRGGVA